MTEIQISTEYIKLDQILKYTGVCFDGAEAKEIIREGFVKVNGETELRRGRKLFKNDEIEIEAEDENILFKVV